MQFNFKVPVTLKYAVENLSNTGRTSKQVIAMAVDVTIVIVALWLAYSLRFRTWFVHIPEAWHVFAILPIIVLLISVSLGIYRWVVRSSSSRLYVQIVKVGILSSLSLVLLLFLLPTEIKIPRSLFVIFGCLYIFLAVSARILWQWMFGNLLMLKKGRPVAIYGAGSSGRQLMQILGAADEYLPVLFIDDDPSLQGTTVYGLRVIDSSRPNLQRTLQHHEVTRIILAMPSVKGAAYRSVLQNLEDVPIPIKTMPALSEMFLGSAVKLQMRDVSIDDLLGRDPVMPDMYLMASPVSRKTVLVTGGGGSIGSELCRQIATLRPAKLIVLEQGEENLYNITEELTPLIATGGIEFVPVLGSVTDVVRLRSIFEKHVINTVFHAAAYKHVPIVESNPIEGLRTNVLGTANVLDVALEFKVATFVLISSDKAVRPTSIMGATKRVAEMLLQARAESAVHTRICMVRFGNVLGSSGSVIPKFNQQINAGGPVTLTHSDITRYFMTIPEASQLVLQAGALADKGEVFVLDMGEPIRIKTLAESLIRLHGLSVKTPNNPAGDIAIDVTKLRPGEKMHEELFISDYVQSTSVSKIFVESVSFLPWNELRPQIEILQSYLDGGKELETKKLLLHLAFTKPKKVREIESEVSSSKVVSV